MSLREAAIRWMQADLSLPSSYMFDEPSSYLDVKQRLNAARIIRSLLTAEIYVICVEHDLSVLDYLSDFICCLYGMPSMYGVVTMPFSVREGEYFGGLRSEDSKLTSLSTRRYQHLPRWKDPHREPSLP